MKPDTSMKLIRVVLAACGILQAMGVHAQTWPAKPVRVVVPFPAGGAVDVGMRAVGAKLSEIWKQPVVVENRGGAGGNIGAEIVAKAAPDGYTLLCTSNALALSTALYRKLPYDAAKDFQGLVQLSSSYLVLAADPILPVASIKELLAYAKVNAGKMTFGSTGVGAAPHLVMEQFKGRIGADILHVPYKGDIQVTAAIMAGDIKLAFLTPSSVISQVKAGKVRALGVTRLNSQAASFPGVPSIAETLPGFEYSGYLGLYGQAAMPRDISGQIQRDASRVLAMTDLQERMAASGFEPPTTSADQFPAKYQRDIATFIKVVRDANIPQQD
jgi:tripartite-type tricarboxylate transporter receptor subunit TctC